MKMQATDSRQDQGTHVRGYISDIEIFGSERDPALMLAVVRDTIARAVADRVLERLGPAIDAAIKEAFAPGASSDPTKKGPS